MIHLDKRILLQLNQDPSRQAESRSLTQSLFFRRLRDEIPKEYENTPLKKELDTLIRTVKTIAGKASEISSYIVTIFPNYTLHNETHFYNVLAFMEQLVPEKTLARLSALECALGILAAFTHDLAMIISEEEKRGTE